MTALYNTSTLLPSLYNGVPKKTAAIRYSILCYCPQKESRKEGGDVSVAKDELLSEMTPRCGSHTGKPVQDQHFLVELSYTALGPLALFLQNISELPLDVRLVYTVTT